MSNATIISREYNRRIMDLINQGYMVSAFAGRGHQGEDSKCCLFNEKTRRLAIVYVDDFRDDKNFRIEGKAVRTGWYNGEFIENGDCWNHDIWLNKLVDVTETLYYEVGGRRSHYFTQSIKEAEACHEKKCNRWRSRDVFNQDRKLTGRVPAKVVDRVRGEHGFKRCNHIEVVTNGCYYTIKAEKRDGTMVELFSIRRSK